MNSSWLVREYTELSAAEFQEILSTRHEVFVVEQECVYEDADECDKRSLHIIRREPSGKLIAYARLLPPGLKGTGVSFGRVLVARGFRGTGLGKRLVAFCIQQCRKTYPQADIQISAQLHLTSFYENFGFESQGLPYADAGIMHIDMLLKNTQHM